MRRRPGSFLTRAWTGRPLEAGHSEGFSGSLEKKLYLEEGGRRQETEGGRQDTGGKIQEAGYMRQEAICRRKGESDLLH